MLGFGFLVFWPARGTPSISPAAELPARLRIEVAAEPGWGEASPEELERVLGSAAGEIWRHCGKSELDPIRVRRLDRHPLTHHERDKDGAILVSLAAEGRRWAQFSYQFAHELGHVLAGHGGEWRKKRRADPHPNRWIEESLCETASLFALRAMAKRWETEPPDPAWRGYARELEAYAGRLLEDPKRRLPAGKGFREWLAAEEPSLRADAEQRDKNAIVAAELLPLFEGDPRGWEAMLFLNLGEGPREPSRRGFFAAWRRDCPERLRAFVERLAKVLALELAQ
jgi:hypothetical protein